MIYHVSFTFLDEDNFRDVYDYYFPTQKEAVAFIKGLTFNEEFEIESIHNVCLEKINLPKTKKEWAWTLTNLVSTDMGTYRDSHWIGRTVSKHTWTHEDGKWSEDLK